jgi:putative MATE family efflux protein
VTDQNPGGEALSVASTDDKLDKKAAARAKKDEQAAADIRRIVEGPLGKGVLRLGLPLSIAMLLQSMFNLVDMAIVGQIPFGASEAIAALIICDLVAMIPTILGNGISNASAALIARRAGEGDKDGAAFYCWQSLSLTLGLSIVFGLLGIFGSDFIVYDIFQAKGELATLTVGYMPVIVGGCFSILLLLQISAILRSLGDGTSPLVLLIGSNVLNLVAACVLVFGNDYKNTPEIFHWATGIADSLGIEPMGVIGAAWATIGARTLALLIGFVALARKSSVIPFKLSHFLPSKRGWSSLMHIAWPNSAQFVLRIAVIEFYHILIVRMFTTATDSAAATAYGICVRLETLVLFISMGWGAAASTYVGQNLGAGETARAVRAGWIATAYNTFFVLLAQALFLFAAGPVMNLFLPDNIPADTVARIVEIGVDYLQIVGASYLLFGVAIVLSQALTGAGVTMLGFALDLVVLLGIAVPVTFLVMAITPLTETLTWILIAGGNILTGLVYIVWYRRGHWAKKQI